MVCKDFLQEASGLKSLGELGERYILEYVIDKLEQLNGSILPPGDDTVDMISSNRIIFSSDMLLESTDIPPGMSFRDVGYKAVTATTSDIAAKGGKPIAYLISLALPSKMLFDEFRELWSGIEEAAKDYGGKIVGGDTNEGRELVVDVICLAEAANPVPRIGMRPGDIVAVTGSFGAQAAGLHALLNNLRGEAIAEKVVKRFLRPKARVNEGIALAKSGALTASMDSSDGLSETLHTLMDLNGYGIRIDNPPIDDDARRYAEKFNVDLFALTFYGGEEYELVVTIKPKMLEDALKSIESVGGKLIPIGRVIEGKTIEAKWFGEYVTVERRGYEHFKMRK
ncbi:MAG: thiamine-phosphate kinase [Thaumarchaeota archaeon]|nr:MAG: thiamine-phosphate kinase [Nitrososphaerota archaeon]